MKEKKNYQTPKVHSYSIKEASIIATSDSDMFNGGDLLRPRDKRRETIFWYEER